MTIHSLATLVKKLRDVQKANGVGYKSTAATSTATSLEKEVDAAIAKAIEPWPFNALESIDS